MICVCLLKLEKNISRNAEADSSLEGTNMLFPPCFCSSPEWTITLSETTTFNSFMCALVRTSASDSSTTKSLVSSRVF